MFKALITTAALTAIAAPAIANDQFAESIGVEPGLYSLNTMILIDQAQKDNEQAVLNALLQRKIGTQVSRSVTSDGQLAASVGVESGSLSTNNLILLDEALRDGDTNADRVAFIRSGRVTASSDATAAKEQIAAGLNVDASSYTLAQLVSLQAQKFNSDNSK